MSFVAKYFFTEWNEHIGSSEICRKYVKWIKNNA